MVSQTSRQLRGAICGNSCYITQIKVFLAQILIYTVQFWQNYFWTQKLMRCLLYLSDIRSGKYFSDNAINILCGEKSDWSGSRVCVDHTGDGGRSSSGGEEERRRGGELQKYFNRSNRYYCCYCYQAKLLSNRSQLAWPLSETLAVLINIRHSPFNNIVFVLNRVEGVFWWRQQWNTFSLDLLSVLTYIEEFYISIEYR